MGHLRLRWQRWRWWGWWWWGNWLEWFSSEHSCCESDRPSLLGAPERCWGWQLLPRGEEGGVGSCYRDPRGTEIQNSRDYWWLVLTTRSKKSDRQTLRRIFCFSSLVFYFSRRKEAVWVSLRIWSHPLEAGRPELHWTEVNIHRTRLDSRPWYCCVELSSSSSHNITQGGEGSEAGVSSLKTKATLIGTIKW